MRVYVLPEIPLPDAGLAIFVCRAKDVMFEKAIPSDSNRDCGVSAVSE